ncbi:MAG: VWA domain-containing protein [Pseudomonadota bacterium]
MADIDAWRIEARVLAFLAAARTAGFSGGVGDAVTAVSVAHRGAAVHRARFRAQMRSVVCGTREEWRRFDAFFDRWFERERVHLDGADPELQGVAAPDVAPTQSTARPLDDAAAQAGASESDGVPQHLDFAAVFDPREMADIERWIDQLTRRIRRRLARRRRPSAHGRLHFPRTLRRAHATGGEPVRLATTGRRRQLPHLVVFVDVSQSMSAYAHFFLRFAKGLAGAFEQCEVYGFDTELMPLGDVARSHGRLDRALQDAPVWRGGTRIAHAIDTFLRCHARTALKRRSTVLILSDGFDTAPPSHLAEQMAALRRQVKRVLWLHPLLERENGPALDPCIVQARPHIDKLLPAQSLAALEAIAAELG